MRPAYSRSTGNSTKSFRESGALYSKSALRSSSHQNREALRCANQTGNDGPEQRAVRLGRVLTAEDPEGAVGVRGAPSGFRGQKQIVEARPDLATEGRDFLRRETPRALPVQRRGRVAVDYEPYYDSHGVRHGPEHVVAHRVVILCPALPGLMCNKRA